MNFNSSSEGGISGVFKADHKIVPIDIIAPKKKE